MSTFARSLAAAAAASTLLLAGCAGGAAAGGSDAELGSEQRPVRLGVVGASDPYWAAFEDAVDDAGIAIDIVDFTEYTQLNPALAEGDLDINQFQHIQYLADYDVSSGEDLQPIGATAIYPLGLYSTQYGSAEEIPDGATVIVPNDTVNQARGLLVLQAAGLVELADGGSATSTLEDVEDGSRVEVQALDASLTAGSLSEAAAAIVNNDFLDQGDLTEDERIAADDPSDPSALPYVNVFAVRAEDVDDAVLQQLVEIYQTTQAVTDGVVEQSGGTAVLATTPVADLQASLAEVEQSIRDDQ